VPLVREPREDELTGDESLAGIEPAAADQKRVRTRAAAQAGRFEVEEDKRNKRWGIARKCTGRRGALGQRATDVTDGLSPVRRIGMKAAFDDEARTAVMVAPFAAENPFEVAFRPPKGGRYA
jgi:hypothetical protein